MVSLIAQNDERFIVGLSVKPFNWRMRKARQEKGLTQGQLGELVGISAQAIGLLERFAGNTLPWDVLDRIATCLDSDVLALFPPWFQARIVREIVAGDMPVYLTKDVADDADLATLLIRQQLTKRLSVALETLSDRQRRVIEMRFGIDDGQEKTLDSIGRTLGYTRETVRQIEARALRKLRHPSVSGDLCELMEAAS